MRNKRAIVTAKLHYHGYGEYVANRLAGQILTNLDDYAKLLDRADERSKKLRQLEIEHERREHESSMRVQSRRLVFDSARR